MYDVEAWDQWAKDRPGRQGTNAAGETTWFNWTIHPDHGPGVEVLGDIGPGTHVLELGCGSGGNLAHVATLGADAAGIDLSPVQARAAGGRYPHLTVHVADARRFLAASPALYHVVYSVYGASWFTDPDELLPLVLSTLAPGGRYAFSQNPPALPGCVGPQATQMKSPTPGEPLYVKRWDYEPDDWEKRMKEAGFVDVQARIIAPPPGRRAGTLLVTGDKSK
ncbi:class I SAM-dependent methyltransferase [Streptomyces sp. CC208A]|uniref:class I SAM-dependent methyltransferase n=1 Tax=Streptomyces sp. CC208A TaxID=3044573 RepID=UPI0024A94818|nr:class I SAM-dependent methyltransferase [Streptomyces sp. CC208A]